MSGQIRGGFPRRGFRAPSTIPIIGDTPPAILLDRLNREVKPGDQIVLPNTREGLFNWTVVAVQPVPPGPNVPPGAVQFIVSTKLAMITQGGRPDQEVILVAAAPEPETTEPAPGQLLQIPGDRTVGNDPADQTTDPPPLVAD